MSRERPIGVNREPDCKRELLVVFDGVAGTVNRSGIDLDEEAMNISREKLMMKTMNKSTVFLLSGAVEILNQ
jgi:hypothetical protein